MIGPALKHGNLPVQGWSMGRLVGFTLVFTMIVVGIVSGLVVQFQSSSAMDEMMTKNANRTFGYLLATIIEPVIAEDSPSIETIVKQVVGIDPDVREISVRNETGQNLAKWVASDGLGSRSLKIERDVKFEGEFFGSVTMSWDMTRLDKAADNSVIWTAAIAMSGAFVFGVAVWILMNLLAVKPIKELTENLLSLEKGDGFVRRTKRYLAQESEVLNQMLERVLSLELKKRAALEAAQLSAEAASKAVRESEARFRDLIESSILGTLISDGEDQPLFANQAMANLMGYETAEEITSLESGDIIAPHDLEKARRHWAAMKRGEEVPPHYEADNLHRDGSYIPVQCFCRKIVWEGVDAVQRIYVDLSERKQAEEALHQAKMEAETAALQAQEANTAKSTFLANMSHELRTPMNGVLGMANVLSTSDLTTDQRDNVETIKESGEALLDLLNDILDLSKIEAGHVELEALDFSIGTMLTSANTLWAHLAQDKGLAFSVENNIINNDLIRTDRSRLRQVINNLVGNAIKFTSKGRVEIGLAEERRDDGRIGLRFEVRDTGIGLSAEQIEKLFKPFAQADSSTTRKYGGTGLGLTISKNIVELLGGDIGVESTPGEGSTFWFTAIVERGDPAKIQLHLTDAESLPLANTGDGRALRILIAEDNQINQKVVRWLLVPLNCQLDIVENGLEAVAAITRSKYDLVLMDVQMPEMDGVAATKKIRSLPDPVASIPIIAMTANAMQGDREEYLEAGMNEYVTKPIDQRALLGAITRCAKISMPDLDAAAIAARSNPEDEYPPLTEKAAEELDDLMGDLEKLLDGTGR